MVTRTRQARLALLLVVSLVIGFIVACGGKTAKVDIGPTRTYTHPAGSFSIDIPENWNSQDMSDQHITRVMFTDPNQNAALAVVIIPTSGQVNSGNMVDILKQDVLTTFGKETNFATQDGIAQPGGSVTQEFTYDSKVGEKSIPMKGSSRLQLDGANATLIYSIIPQDQAETLTPKIDDLIRSLRVTQTASPTVTASLPIATTTPPTPGNTTGSSLAPVEIGELKTYEHPNGVFTIDVPRNWTAQEQSDETMVRVFFTDPKENAMIAVVVIPTEGGVDKENLADLLTSDVKSTFSENKNFDLGEPKKQNDGSIGVVFTYDTMAGTVEAEMLGNGFIQLDGTHVTLLYVIVPSDQFDALVSDTNKIINTLKVAESGAGEEESYKWGEDTGWDDTGIFAAMQTYQYPTGLFTLDIPGDWNVQDTSNSELVTMIWHSNAETFEDFALVGVILVNSPTELSSDDVRTLLKEQIASSAFGSYDEFSMEEPKEQPDGSILLPFGYSESGMPLQGYAYGKQRGDKFSVLMLITAKEHFNDHWDAGLGHIANSYSIDPSMGLQ